MITITSNSLKSKKNNSIENLDKEQKLRTKTMRESSNSQTRFSTTWKTLPKLNSLKGSRSTKSHFQDTKRENGRPLKLSTNVSMPTSRERILTAIKSSPITIDTPTNSEQQEQLQQRYFKNYKVSSVTKTASSQTSWKKLDDWQFLHMQMQNLSIKKQRRLQQKPCISQPVSDTLGKKKKQKRYWHSLPKLSNKFIKHASNNHFSEAMLEDPPIITEEDLILEGNISTLEGSQ